MERPDQKRKNTFARLASVFTLVGALCCLASLVVRSFLASLPSYVQEEPYAASVMASIRLYWLLGGVGFAVMALVFGVIGLRLERHASAGKNRRDLGFSILGMAGGGALLVAFGILQFVS